MLNKQALLDFIKARKANFAGSYKDIEHGAYLELDTIEAHLESGRFDSPSDDRLRAALERITKLIDNAKKGTEEQLIYRIWITANEALSTTEPTESEDEIDMMSYAAGWEDSKEYHAERSTSTGAQEIDCDLKVGDKVRHKDMPELGTGEITDIAKSGIRARVKWGDDWDRKRLNWAPYPAYYRLDKLIGINTGASAE